MKNSAIQSIKGIAALVVLLSHTTSVAKSNFFTQIHDSWLHLFCDGSCAVVVFFTITGFFSYKILRDVNMGGWYVSI